MNFEAFMDRLAQSPAILIGENHERYDHHLTQLEILCRLHRRYPDLVVGIEYLPKAVQGPLDDYLAGRLDTDGFLEKSGYYRHWGYDFRLYAPILGFAREREIPVIALNLPAAITRKVSRRGTESLTDEERAQIPAHIGPADPQYRARLEAVFAEHSEESMGDFENFLNVQLLWDETMAETAALYLKRHPSRKLIVLAGNGHVAHRNAIPARLARRAGVATTAISLEIDHGATELDADYRVIPREVELPPAGKLGVLLETDEEGVRIASFSETSVAELAGVRTGDRIVMLDDRPVASFADVKIALWRKIRGESVDLTVGRGAETLRFELALQ